MDRYICEDCGQAFGAPALIHTHAYRDEFERVCPYCHSTWFEVTEWRSDYDPDQEDYNV